MWGLVNLYKEYGFILNELRRFWRFYEKRREDLVSAFKRLHSFLERMDWN